MEPRSQQNQADALIALIVFIKNPIPGHAKQRLSASIGVDKAHQVYIELLKQTREVASQFPGERHLFYDQYLEQDDGWSPALFHKALQMTGDLGERMAHAFKHVFAQAGDRLQGVIIIGADCPSLKLQHLTTAVDALKTNNVVIGPAEDGGYYLLGMDKFYPQLFMSMSWSSPKLLDESWQVIRANRLSAVELDTLYDIDTLNDLQRSQLRYLLDT